MLINILIGMLPFIIGGFFLCEYIEWRSFNNSEFGSDSYNNTAFLTWNTLKNFYAVNPKRFRYEKIIKEGYNTIYTDNSYLLFNGGNAWSKTHFSDYYENRDQIVRIQLSFFGYLAFKWKKNHQGSVSGGGIDTIIAATTRDIKAKRQMAEKQIEQATEEIQKITERLGK